MVNYISNIPDQEHVPYKIITAQPHLKKLVGYMRASDYAVWGAVAVGFPAAQLIWGAFSPALKKLYLFKLRTVVSFMPSQIPAAYHGCANSILCLCW
ncbi:hypothetical protein HK096_002326, partial [Nowakowskiella sp. JEL0078]